MKRCLKCGEGKEVSEFYLNAQAKDGHSTQCKTCQRASTAAYQKELRQQSKIAMHVMSAKTRAKREGIPFSITVKDVKTPKRCPVFGMVLNYDGTGRGYGAKDDAASLDRIYPEKGYVPGNVIVVSWKANRTKSHLTPADTVRLAKFYSSFL